MNIVFQRIAFIFSALAAVAICSLVAVQASNARGDIAARERFRSIVPHHMQDWIVAGEGSVFTLIYSEPPPAYDRGGYEKLFQATFRGFKKFDTASSKLGFNGSYTDIVAQMDYGFAGERALDELEVDLRALSQEIYGTSYGARALRLSDLEKRPPARDSGPPLEISAAEVQDWLNDSEVIFAAPETGVAGSLAQIRKHRSGRYLSSDGSLVLLVVDRGRAVEFSNVRHIRHFVLDSDLIVGGVVDNKRDLTYVVGRARQLNWADFPPLRVEDVLNLIKQKSGSLAQSYDRTTPGAGRVTHNGQQHDWAPSFLSRELFDTEFGSLLNKADAILKSQSLGDAISYVGFDISGIPNPPDNTNQWSKGVWDRLNAETPLTSLIFNFNTVGAGHWYVVDDKTRVYAPNRTGSYSVTYSPFEAGETSLNQEAALIAKAEQDYGAWFNSSGNIALARAVQYTSLFQIFAEPGEVKVAGYPDRDARFYAVGDALRIGIAKGFEACLPFGQIGEERFAALRASPLGRRNEFPDNRETLIALLGDVATKFRYNGNIFGSESQEASDRANAVLAQLKEAKQRQSEAEDKFLKHVDHLNQNYSVEMRIEPMKKGLASNDGEKRVSRVGLFRGSSRWVPNFGQAGRDRSTWDSLLLANNQAVDYVVELKERRRKMLRERRAVRQSWGGRQEIAKETAHDCDKIAGTNNRVFDAYTAWTVETDKDGEEVPFLRTPTVVLSRNVLDDKFLGGHNVKRRGLEVRLDTEANVGPEEGLTLWITSSQ